MNSDYVSGKFKLIRLENFEEYMKHIGLSFFWRKAVNATTTFVQGESCYDSSSGGWHMKGGKGPFAQEFVLKIGVPFEEKRVDGRVAKTMIQQIGDNTFSQVLSYENGIEVTVLREYFKHEAVFTFTTGNLVAKQFWRRWD